jgi:hypothetical protein
MQTRRSVSSLLALAAWTLQACGSPETSGAGQGATVDVHPPAVEVAAGGQVDFEAAVTGSADVSVLWEVVEAGGGTVDATGLYTAPGAAGTFHVRATSRANPGARGTATVTVAPPVAVAVVPRTATVPAGGTFTFSATVTGTANQGVTWAVQEPGCGSITPGGVYTAPAAAATCHVLAASVADPSRRATATVNVSAPPPPVTVSITPATGAVSACRTLTFRATVANASDTSVTWSVQEGAAGGTVDANGAYTAPDTAGTYHVVATSRADPTRTAVAPVDVTDLVLAVAVSPPNVTVPAGGTAQFTASVTTTCGTFDSVRTITASAAGAITVE